MYQWPVGQAVKTAASHAANMGSIPVRVTKYFKSNLVLDKLRKSDIILIVEKDGKERKAQLEFFFAYFLFQKKVSWC